jgi:hypothetical protein
MILTDNILLGCLQHQSITVDWFGADSKILFEQHVKDPDHFRNLRDLGFLIPGCVTYKYNSCGFRSEEFDNRSAGVAVGCSFTKGIGIPVENSWPSQLSTLLEHHIWNLGVGGGSLDTAYNLLEHYINKLNTKFVVLCAPPPDRFEFFQNNIPLRVLANNTQSFKQHGTFFKEWFLTEKNAMSSYKKNILAMQQMCLQCSIPFYYLSVGADFSSDHKARDLLHPGVDANYNFALKMHEKIINERL